MGKLPHRRCYPGVHLIAPTRFPMSRDRDLNPDYDSSTCRSCRWMTSADTIIRPGIHSTSCPYCRSICRTLSTVKPFYALLAPGFLVPPLPRQHSRRHTPDHSCAGYVWCNYGQRKMVGWLDLRHTHIDNKSYACYVHPICRSLSTVAVSLD